MTVDGSGILLELDFGDDEFVVRRHPDGIVSVDVATGRLLLNEEQFVSLVKEFIDLASRGLTPKEETHSGR